MYSNQSMQESVCASVFEHVEVEVSMHKGGKLDIQHTFDPTSRLLQQLKIDALCV